MLVILLQHNIAYGKARLPTFAQPDDLVASNTVHTKLVSWLFQTAPLTAEEFGHFSQQAFPLAVSWLASQATNRRAVLQSVDSYDEVPLSFQMDGYLVMLGTYSFCW